MIRSKRERAEYISSELEKLYPNPSIPLKHTDPYTLLVAVLLSAQCTDLRVNQVTPSLFKLAKTPEKMAKQSVDSILEIIKPCGLGQTKAKNIKALSEILVRDFKGVVPNDLAALETLPGVGHKTASVVVIQAFNGVAFPVDTHIHRLAKRWRLSDGSSVLKSEEDLKGLFPENKWAKLHLQIIYYGREHCSARGCDGTTCLICHTVNLD